MPDLIRLDPVDYWRLRALSRDIEAAELDVLKAKLALGQALDAAKERANAALTAAAKTYHFDPAVPHAWNDEQLALVPPSPKVGAPQ